VPDHADFAAHLPDVLGRFGHWTIGDPTPVPGGSLNWNYRAETDGGLRFVRRYRDDLETERILGEHRLIAWVAEFGVPAPVPERTPEESTIAQIAHGRWSCFPWVDGSPRPRGTLTSAQARNMGSLHGYTQAVLAGHPESQGAAMTMTWDRAQSQTWLARIREKAAESGAETWILDGLRRQAEMLDELDVLPPAAFASLPVQVLHGDFHDQQVLWQGDQIAGLVDWEIWHTDPRVWELVRSLSFSLLLDSPLMEEYLAGYREFVQLSEAECRLGLSLWFQSRVVGLWAWAAHFLEGNARVKDFFPEMIAALDKVADAGWKAGIEERFVRAATG